MKVSRKAGANSFRQNHSTTIVISLVVVHGEEVKLDAQVVMKISLAMDSLMMWNFLTLWDFSPISCENCDCV